MERDSFINIKAVEIKRTERYFVGVPGSRSFSALRHPHKHHSCRSINFAYSVLIVDRSIVHVTIGDRMSEDTYPIYLLTLTVGRSKSVCLRDIFTNKFWCIYRELGGAPGKSNLRYLKMPIIDLIRAL